MTSTTIYTIAPTYLYIKQHSVTGLKYFGKTTRDPYKYLGSGKHWTRHYKKHGKEHIKTIWVSDLYYDTSIIDIALQFSTENNIVESKEWANLEPENGLAGALSGSDNPMYGKKGKDNPNFGKTSIRRVASALDTWASLTNEQRSDRELKRQNTISERTREQQDIINKKISSMKLGTKMPTRTDETLLKLSLANGKNYLVTSPEGEQFQICSLTAFCKKNNLHNSAMSEVSRGKRKSHKGWLCVRLPD